MEDLKEQISIMDRCLCATQEERNELLEENQEMKEKLKILVEENSKIKVFKEEIKNKGKLVKDLKKSILHFQ